jgi:phage RecT family recombinase
MIKEILKNIDNEITFFSEKNGFDKKEFVIAIEQSYNNSKKIQTAFPNTISSTILTCAELGLIPNNHSDHCLMYSEHGICKFYLQYKGLIHLMYRTMGVTHIEANVINKNDFFEYESSPTVKITHKPNILDSGQTIGVYSKVTHENGQTFAEVIPIKVLNDIQKISKSRFWDSKNDPNQWMKKKTAIKQSAKLLPPSNVMSLALKQDDLSEGGKAVYIEKGEVVEAKKNEFAQSEQKRKSDALLCEAINKLKK